MVFAWPLCMAWQASCGACEFPQGTNEVVKK